MVKTGWESLGWVNSSTGSLVRRCCSLLPQAFMLSYLPLVPVFLLLFTALAIYLIRLARPGFAYFWLVAAASTLLAWPATLILGRFLPLTRSLGSWPAEFFSASPALLVDSISWPYGLALSTLVLAMILTDVARYVEIDWVVWAGSLALAALGILAVFSANPLTLLLFWGAIDLVELTLLLNQVEGSLSRERVVISFSARVFGILLLLAGILAAKGSGVPLTFELIPRTSSVYLLLASILRLGVVPLHLPILHDPRQRRGLGTMGRLVPAAASLVLLNRVAVSGVSANLEVLFLGISGLTVLYAGFSWLIAPDELEGRAYWMLGMASLVLAAAVRGQPGASQAWGIALLLSGGLLFLFSARTRFLLILPLLSFFGLSTLPLTPTWPGVNLYLAPLSPMLALLLLGQVLLLMGYLRHVLRPEPGPAVIERWILFVYPLGLVFLLVAHLLIGWFGLQETGPVTFARLLPGLLSLALLALGIFAWQNSPEFPPRFRQKLRSVLGFQWLYRLFWEVYRTLSRLARFISLVLDGEGGVLWALLLLTLLMAFIIQGRFGR